MFPETSGLILKKFETFLDAVRWFGIKKIRIKKMDDIEIYRTAELFISEFQADAILEAEKKGEELKNEGDLEAWAYWDTVAEEIKWIQAHSTARN